MDITELKHQARALEQQGNLGQALETYRQILTEIDAIGGIRQELPVLIKIGDLYLKTGDVDQAVDSYERAAGEYALQGASQPVMSLCTKILRADPQAVGAYLRLARRLLDSGFPDGAREVLIDYAQRGKLDRTREGLERLAGRADDEVKRVLAKAIESAEERIPKRVPHPKAPPPPPPPPAPPPPVSATPSALDLEQGLVSLESPKEPPPPPKRLTVPVGALDAEPEPSLLETHPPQPPPPPTVMPELAFPTAEELQAVMPEMPPAAASQAPPAPAPSTPAASPLPPPPPPPAKLDLETSIAPPMEGMISTMPPAGAPPPAPPEPSQPRLSVPMMEAMIEPPPQAPPGQGPGEAWPARRERPSRPSHAIPEESPRVSHAQPRTSRASLRSPARPSRGAPAWVWPVLGLAVLAGVIGVLIWQQVIPMDWLRNLLHRQEAAVEAPPPRPAPRVRPDTVMARDTATVTPPHITRPAPAPPPVEEPPRRLAAPTLPPGVALTRSVMLVSGLQVESVSQIEADGKTGISIVQVLSTGQRVTLEEFPTDTVGAAGEIGVTGIPPDTVVGHVRVADLEIRIKGVGIPEDRIVQFLQELVEVKP